MYGWIAFNEQIDAWIRGHTILPTETTSIQMPSLSGQFSRGSPPLLSTEITYCLLIARVDNRKDRGFMLDNSSLLRISR